MSTHHGSTGSIGIEGYLIDPTIIAQTPQTVTDSSTNDSRAIYITVAGVTNDIIGYHFVGEITNVGRAAIYNVQATAHLDDSSTEVGNTTQYTKPENIGVGQTASFDPTFDKYAKAINAKAQPFPSEPVITALLFSQHKLIKWLEGQISEGKTNVLNPLDQSLNEISHNHKLND